MPRETDPVFSFYTHLQHYPDPDEALRILERVASLVTPLMRAHGWRVKVLSEMYPERASLLGLNQPLVNGENQILLRLREANDRTRFLPLEKIADVVLHELVHMDREPHDSKFLAMWNQLRRELDALVKSYTGESFLARAQHLAGRNGNILPPDEPRHAASGSSAFGSQGYRLGTSAPPPRQGVRNAALGSFERWDRDDAGCANTDRTQAEIQAISQVATRNGFRTRAEENATNEAAMAQAMWELMQDEKRKDGNSYMPSDKSYRSSDVEDLFGSNRGAFSWRSGGPSSWRNDSYLYGTDFGRDAERIPPVPSVTRPPAPPRFPEAKASWACSFCTLRNPSYATACEACRFPRPGGLSWNSAW